MFGCSDSDSCSGLNFFMTVCFIFLWMWRSRRQSRRLAALEHRLDDIGTAIAGLSSPAAPEAAKRTAPAAAGFEPVAAAAQVVTPNPIVAPALAAALLSVATPSPAPTQTAPVRPTPPAAPPRPPEPTPAPSKPIEWERWIGVRGAALVGGVVLALAGLMFFKYSIEHGLISPTTRVILATLVGMACIGGSQTVLRRRYAITANSMAGAGLVIFYSAFWAAHALYHLVDAGPTMVLMILVTAVGGLLAVRHSALIIAVLGLAGGFLTPVLLSTGQDRPIGLFGYLLLLDAGVFYVARKRNWRVLMILSLTGTALYQLLWIGGRMGHERLLLGLAILGVFALAFAVFGHFVSGKNVHKWFGIQAASLLLPFGFALYFAGDSGFGPHVYEIAALLAILSVSAAWIGRTQKQPWLGIAAASATLAVLTVYLMRTDLTRALTWEAAGVCVALALVFHIFVELDRDAPIVAGPAIAAIVSSAGFLFLLVISAGKDMSFFAWPLLAGWLALAALLVRHASFPARPWLQMVAAAEVGLGLALLHWVHGGSASLGSLSHFMALLIAIAIAFQFVGFARRQEAARMWAEHAAALLSIILLLSLTVTPTLTDWPARIVLGGGLGLGILAALASSRSGRGGWLLGAAAATAVVGTVWVMDNTPLVVGRRELLEIFALQIVSVAFFTVWPFATVRRFMHSHWAWYSAALCAPFWFHSMRSVYVAVFGNDTIGILPVALGAVSLVCALRSRDVWAADRAMAKSTLVWFAAVALCFISIAIPLQLDKQWITIGWAVEGLSVLLLWQRLDHPGLKYLAFALFAAVFYRLIYYPTVIGYYDRPAWRIVNWLTYSYLVPAACMVGGALALRKTEVARARDWETYYQGGVTWGAGAASLAGIVTVFVWINLTIADWFSTGRVLDLSLERLPARDVALSVCWAIYALILLTIGMAGKIKALRWVSLVLLLVTIGKVFLYDLGNLKDLYRVMSLVGLAVSLMIVSLAYQRFVFAGKPAEKK